MEVILLERVTKLGALGTLVKVKPGFARNYLIPQGKALPATKNNVAQFEAQRAELEKASEKRLEETRKRGEALEGISITLEAQAGEEGRLFGSISTLEISRALSEKGIKVLKSEVRLPEGPIRLIGDYDVQLHLQGGEVISTIKVSVVPAA